MAERRGYEDAAGSQNAPQCSHGCRQIGHQVKNIGRHDSIKFLGFVRQRVDIGLFAGHVLESGVANAPFQHLNHRSRVVRGDNVLTRPGDCRRNQACPCRNFKHPAPARHRLTGRLDHSRQRSSEHPA